MYPIIRNRRLRATESIRNLVRETRLSPHDFLVPLFVEEGKGVKIEIPSMPGYYRFSLDLLQKEVKELWSMGLCAVLVFVKVEDALKDNKGTEAVNPDGLMQRAVKTIKEACPDMLVMTDVALDPYSSYGHDGIVEEGHILNDETVELFTQLTRYPRTVYAAHYELGLLAEENNDIEAVLVHYRQVRSGPKFLPAAVRLSRFMTDHDQLDDARLYLQKLRLDHPQQASALYQIESELLAEQQLLREAYDMLSKAILREPNNIQLLYTRSLLSERQNDFARSEQDLRAILQQDANNAMALNALGYTLTVHTDRYEEAHKLILRALELNPGDPATIDSLGWVSYRLGKYDEAIKYLRDALSKLPDPEVAAHLGEVLWVTGQHDEAMSIWKKVLANDPDNSTILETMERLTNGITGQ